MHQDFARSKLTFQPFLVSGLNYFLRLTLLTRWKNQRLGNDIISKRLVLVTVSFEGVCFFVLLSSSYLYKILPISAMEQIHVNCECA